MSRNIADITKRAGESASSVMFEAQMSLPRIITVGMVVVGGLLCAGFGWGLHYAAQIGYMEDVLATSVALTGAVNILVFIWSRVKGS